MLIFARSFNSKEPDDVGDRANIQPGDHVTFLHENIFHSRICAAVAGAIIEMEPFPGEKAWFIKRENVCWVLRPDLSDPDALDLSAQLAKLMAPPSETKQETAWEDIQALIDSLPPK